MSPILYLAKGRLSGIDVVQKSLNFPWSQRFLAEPPLFTNYHSKVRLLRSYCIITNWDKRVENKNLYRSRDTVFVQGPLIGRPRDLESFLY